MKQRIFLIAMAALLSLMLIVPAALADGTSPVEAEGLVGLGDEDAAALLEALESAEHELPEGDSFRITVNPDDLSVQEGLDPDWQHILLMGTDTGNKVLNYGRTDTMIIASINASFLPRDPPLICFSRVMAASIVSATSNQTSILQP